jgi:hypothetical protein
MLHYLCRGRILFWIARSTFLAFFLWTFPIILLAELVGNVLHRYPVLQFAAFPHNFVLAPTTFMLSVEDLLDWIIFPIQVYFVLFINGLFVGCISVILGRWQLCMGWFVIVTRNSLFVGSCRLIDS